MKRIGRFEVEAEIGRGAMGVVYRGRHPGLGLPVAIKVLSQPFSGDEGFRSRFRREASLVARLDHPGVVRVLDFDADGDDLFIVMEYVGGRPLRQLIGEGSSLAPDKAIDVTVQVLSALGAAHAEGVVHRDLKPDNVLVTPEGKTKILDFGIARLSDDDGNLTVAGAMVGTPAYMSPEQVKGEVTDRRSDLYSLGVMLYEMLTGAPPFGGAIPKVLHAQTYEMPPALPGVSEELGDIVLRALAKQPDDRFQSAEDFATALSDWLAAEHRRRLNVTPLLPPGRQRMGQELRRRLQAGFATPARARGGSCTATGCDGYLGWRCSYVDALGQRCTSWWCRHHVQVLEGQPFCPRHAAVVRALEATAGTIREVKHRPLVDDRSLNLTCTVADDADRDLSELVRRRHQGEPGVVIVADRSPRQVIQTAGEIAWERTWAALKGQTYLDRISIRVSPSESDRVRVTVGRQVVFDARPGWTTRSDPDGEPDRESRFEFRRRLVAAVTGALHGTPPPPVRQTSDLILPSLPVLDARLVESLILQRLPGTRRVSAAEVCHSLGLPLAAIEGALSALVSSGMIEVHGLATTTGPWTGRPLAERMLYSITPSGQKQLAEGGAPRWSGPAPVDLEEYRRRLPQHPARRAIAAISREVDDVWPSALRRGLRNGGPLILRGGARRDRQELCARLHSLLETPVEVPLAVEVEGRVLSLFDDEVHQPWKAQPADRRWRRISPPLIHVSADAGRGILEAVPQDRDGVWRAPELMRASGGVLVIEDVHLLGWEAHAFLNRLAARAAAPDGESGEGQAGLPRDRALVVVTAGEMEVTSPETRALVDLA